MAYDSDTLSRALDNVTIKGQKVNSYIGHSNGQSVISMELMRQMPRILGNADPIHYAQMLPGVQTNSEYDAGLHIYGCDNAHNQLSINGVPIYNVSHMLGFFSIFNATHYSNMWLSKSVTSPDAPNRIGGTIDICNADSVISTSLSGDVSIGPMSSQGTLRIPTGRKSSLVISARTAYLNMLYSKWMTIDGEDMRYSFGDYNLTYYMQVDENNLAWIDFYYGNDDVGYSDNQFSIDTSLEWNNMMGALHWRHKSHGITIYQTAYYTSYENHFSLNQTNVNVSLPSSIADIGYKLKADYGLFTAGLDVVHHSIYPQNPKVDGLFKQEGSDVSQQHSTEASLFFGLMHNVASNLSLSAGMRLNLYNFDDNNYISSDPNLTLGWEMSTDTKLTLSGSIRHQYLFNSGFSNIGLPTEFWFSSGGVNRPQYSYNASLSLETFFDNRKYRIEAELYYKRLMNQVEYDGNVFDFIYSDYSLDDILLRGNGYNYGASIMIEKRKGKLTGWLSYSYGRAKRRYPDTKYSGTYPANHERIHELNVVATMKAGKRWSIGATFVAASGTPYTKAERFYIISNHLLTEYGTHNGSRVDTYMRLDLSASYDFINNGKRRSGINLSLYNATMHQNNLFYRLKVSGDGYAYRPFTFLIKLLPSVNYYYSF
ncbi:MAG: TonB-dependent receptor [Prevotellaceae bacterium]|nr:TonB-dependent receptor [Prevotellaceae bacterium]